MIFYDRSSLLVRCGQALKATGCDQAKSYNSLIFHFQINYDACYYNTWYNGKATIMTTKKGENHEEITSDPLSAGYLLCNAGDGLRFFGRVCLIFGMVGEG